MMLIWKENELFYRDSYVGSYSASYDKITGTEFVFGGTSVERENGNKLEISCSITINNGKAMIFLSTGNEEPVSILENSDEYIGTIEVGNGSNYIGICTDDFSGSIELEVCNQTENIK